MTQHACPASYRELPSRVSSSVAIDRRARTRVVERTQKDRFALIEIRCVAKEAHILVKLVLVPIARSARGPGIINQPGDPLEIARGERGEAVSLVEDRGSVAPVDEVDEEGAGGGRIVVCEQAIVGVYIDGLDLLRVLSKNDISYWSDTRPLHEVGRAAH